MSRILNAMSGNAPAVEKVRIREEDGKKITVSIKDASTTYDKSKNIYELTSKDPTEVNSFIAIEKDYIHVNSNAASLYSDPTQSFKCTSTTVETFTESDMTIASCFI